jgi:site-specific DNA-methyltransferase (adenine-specific)
MILVGDCRARLRELDDESVDAIVTDPPYELGFMGKSWDASGIAYDGEVWRQALRVLKPGGHLLAFSGSRTYHRMVVAIEDAGFEIRDQIMWLYGSGFPKSHDVSKAIDREAGAVREVVGTKPGVRGADGTGMERQMPGKATGIKQERCEVDITAPATPEAARWQGWGTALKPAHEPICVARKPLRGTVAANVLAYGTGAINVDGCRVGWASDSDKQHGRPASSPKAHNGLEGQAFKIRDRSQEDPEANQSSLGRWPANVIHDGSEEVVGMFPNVKGQIGMQTIVGGFRFIEGDTTTSRRFITGIHDSGSAARFFYSAKASKADRDEGMEGWEAQAVHRYGAGLGEGHDPNAPAINRNIHPTVKPTDLMRYLVRLVTPPGGLVLDPFTGSGSTGKAAVLEGMRFIGCELSPEYAAIAEARIKAAAVKTGQVFEIPASPAPGRKADGEQLRLFA